MLSSNAIFFLSSLGHSCSLSALYIYNCVPFHFGFYSYLRNLIFGNSLNLAVLFDLHHHLCIKIKSNLGCLINTGALSFVLTLSREVDWTCRAIEPHHRHSIVTNRSSQPRPIHSPSTRIVGVGRKEVQRPASQCTASRSFLANWRD
jgi:hypothetical protein